MRARGGDAVATETPFVGNGAIRWVPNVGCLGISIDAFGEQVGPRHHELGDLRHRQCFPWNSANVELPVEKLDVFADQTMFKALDHTGHLCVMASEENETVLLIPEQYPCGKYVLNYGGEQATAEVDGDRLSLTGLSLPLAFQRED